MKVNPCGLRCRTLCLSLHTHSVNGGHSQSGEVGVGVDAVGAGDESHKGDGGVNVVQVVRPGSDPRPQMSFAERPRNFL